MGIGAGRARRAQLRGAVGDLELALGVRRSSTAPGTSSSLAVVSTMFCNAAWSIGLSADESAVELGREHAAIRNAPFA